MHYYEQILSDEQSLPIEIFIQSNHPIPFDVSPHWHDCFEILFYIKGTAIQTVQQETYLCRPGDIVLIKSGDVHSTASTDDAIQILVLKFMPSLIDRRYALLADSKYIASFLNYKSESLIRHLDLDHRIQIKQILTTIYQEFIKQASGYDLFIRSEIYRLIGTFVRFNLIELPKEVDKPYDLERIHKVLIYIEQNFHKPIHLEDICEILHMNYSYSSRYFTKVTGKSFKEYLTYIRICEAEQRIQSSQIPIAQIAFDCGFTSLSSFNRNYKRIKGFSPRTKR